MSPVPALYDTDSRPGPALEALPAMQQQFVMALVTLGCTQSKAAELAGYQGGPNTWKAMGWKLAHDPRVQAAILEQSAKVIRTHAPMALNVIVDLARNISVDPRVRLRAAEAILNRGGLHASTEHKITVTERRLNNREQIERIRVLAAGLGMDPARLLGRLGAGEITDAEFSVVGPADDPWTVDPQ